MEEEEEMMREPDGNSTMTLNVGSVINDDINAGITNNVGNVMMNNEFTANGIAYDGDRTLEVDVSSCSTLEHPDIDGIRLERLDRTRAALQALDPLLARSVLPPKEAEEDGNISREVLAAICIQCHYRGYLGRKKYVQALIERFNQEEAMRMKKIQEQVEEGELLIENHKLQVEFEDNHCIRRNRTQLLVSRVITIQRAWRNYKKKHTKEIQEVNSQLKNKDDDEDDKNDSNNTEQLDGNGNPKQSSNIIENKDQINQPSHISQGYKMSMLTKLSADNQPDIIQGLSNQRQDMHKIQGLSNHSPDLQNENETYIKRRPKNLEKDNTNLNRLSLAEEFAQLEEKIFPADNVYESESESDYGATNSSCMTTPDWEAQEDYSKPDATVALNITQDLQKAEKNCGTTIVCNGQSMSHGENTCGELDANANDSDTSEPYTNEVQSSCSETHLEGDRTINSENKLKTEPNRTRKNEEFSKDFEMTCKHLATVTVACDHILPKDKMDCSGLPIMDWDSLEKRIANIERKKEGEKAKELEKQERETSSTNSPKTAQRSCRQEILKRLARAGLSEEDAEGDIYGKGREKLSARLQSGMNLQICFMNDPLSDDDEEVQHAARIRSLQSPNVTVTKVDEDFETRQARLQDEAKIALAQAEPMARMQLEIEKVHGKKLSPVTELAGVTGLDDITPGLSGKMLSTKTLHTMSCSKIKILINDLHRRIKAWNEELMELLIVRDELKNEQDSKLIDIEDLTRWIHMNMQPNNRSNNNMLEECCLENGHKRHYDSLRKLLTRSLPSGPKCLCGFSRSSSVASNPPHVSRSSSQNSSQSPTSPCTARMTLSSLSPSSFKSTSSMTDTESVMPSPEVSWVKSAGVRYWYR